MLKKVVIDGDEARGHTDIQGNEVIGTIQNVSPDVKNSGVGIANANSDVFFPSHAHALTGGGSPTDFRTHTVKITATGKHYANGYRIALDDDVVPVADIAGPNATMLASANKFNCEEE